MAANQNIYKELFLVIPALRACYQFSKNCNIAAFETKKFSVLVYWRCFWPIKELQRKPNKRFKILLSSVSLGSKKYRIFL